MSFNQDEELKEMLDSFMDQIEILQSDIVIMRALIRKGDLESAKDRMANMKKRVDYTMENY